MVFVSLSYVRPYLFALLFVQIEKWLCKPTKIAQDVDTDNLFPRKMADHIEQLQEPWLNLYRLQPKVQASLRAQMCVSLRRFPIYIYIYTRCLCYASAFLCTVAFHVLFRKSSEQSS